MMDVPLATITIAAGSFVALIVLALIMRWDKMQGILVLSAVVLGAVCFCQGIVQPKYTTEVVVEGPEGNLLLVTEQVSPVSDRWFLWPSGWVESRSLSVKRIPPGTEEVRIGVGDKLSTMLGLSGVAGTILTKTDPPILKTLYY